MGTECIHSSRFAIVRVNDTHRVVGLREGEGGVAAVDAAHPVVAGGGQSRQHAGRGAQSDEHRRASIINIRVVTNLTLRLLR